MTTTRAGAAIFWFTGLSGSGKTTVAYGASKILAREGMTVEILDGDRVRAQLHKNLGFSRGDIIENNQRIAALCAEMRASCDAILVPIISPYLESRAAARSQLAPRFYEIYFAAPLPTLMARDPKGLYARAIKGEIPNFIGLSPDSPYEAPPSPELTIDSSRESYETSISRLVDFVVRHASPAAKSA